MRSSTIFIAFTLAGFVLAAPTIPSQWPSSTELSKGINNPTTRSSVGGHAICIEGTIDVTASAENTKLNLDQPKNQTELTNLILELTQINSSLVEHIAGGPIQIKEIFGIYSQICFPKTTAPADNSKVQFLVHGGGFDRLYWDNAAGYSYVDYAAEQGYTTFSYDRLGTGLSDHPDPINTVQTTLHIAIAHELITLLKSGGISGLTFSQVIGVGHSYGSVQLLGITTAFPNDLNTAFLTGASADPDGYFSNIIGQVQTIASQNEPTRFPNLPNGYALPGTIEGLQFGFFRAPTFDPQLLDLAERLKQPQGLGELLLPLAFKPASNFTGPVLVMAGENDLPACDGNCLLPYNKVAPFKNLLFPAASNKSDWYLVPKTGHGINFHYTAQEAYTHITKFLAAIGL